MFDLLFKLFVILFIVSSLDAQTINKMLTGLVTVFSYGISIITYVINYFAI